ncbi:MAG: cysteine--tRNA ligase [Candidatus Hydrothermarchaeota archaeon]|nr:MAG: cysteine--tRNA ligase [Candidatus Hydrothermarchaeota archaeon]
MKFYNTLTRKKEEFIPLEGNTVKIYVCGPTVYDSPHIGHARTYIAFDAIRRYLKYKGYDVIYVVNITNVDDKIINRAKELGEHPLKLAERYEREFFDAMEKLNVEKADFSPRVTEHMQDIINFIQKLIEKGYAYVSEGDVYFSVEKFKEYGKLSHQSLKEIKAGARVEISEKKRNPLDFALWKKAKEGEISWSSPWGEGRPGWHIECSTMSMKYLGETLDIHGGAQDLIFPHHENEIAQSEALTGKTFVRYWLHTGFLLVKGEKMSKSLGNFITIDELLKTYDANSFRFLVLQTHYRSPIDFSFENLEKAKRAYKRLANALDYLKQKLEGANGEDNTKVLEQYKEKFFEALDDDFDTPKAFAILFDFVNFVYKSRMDRKSAEEAIKFFVDVFKIFGFKLEKKIDREKLISLAEEFISEVENKEEKELIEILIEIRAEHRRKKDYKIADYIRDKLKEAGVIVEDLGGKTRWRLER